MIRHPDEPSFEICRGLPVATAPETLLACARNLSLIDLVTVLDSALRNGSTLEQVKKVADQKRRGAPRLREALDYADARSESPWESIMRLLHALCDVPVEPQYVIHDSAGEFIARADLRIGESQTLHEYDGAHHLTRPQQRRDLRRSARFDRC